MCGGGGVSVEFEYVVGACILNILLSVILRCNFVISMAGCFVLAGITWSL